MICEPPEFVPKSANEAATADHLPAAVVEASETQLSAVVRYGQVPLLHEPLQHCPFDWQGAPEPKQAVAEVAAW